jgi:hypothetical protein
MIFDIFPKRQMSITEEVLTTVISGAAYVVFAMSTLIIEISECVVEVFDGTDEPHNQTVKDRNRH